MKTIFLSSLLSIAFGCLYNSAHAQKDSTGDKFNFKAGLYYNSHLNYYGRTDSLRSSGAFAMAEIWFKNKFYVNVAPVFAHNLAGFHYAGAVAAGGYAYNNGKTSTNIYLVKPIYKNNSQLVQSSLKVQGAASITWLNKIINMTGGADVKFSKNTDYGMTAGIDHIFRKKLRGNAILVIDPSAFMYAGTQRFTQTYYEKTGFLLFPGTERSLSRDVEKFNILSYEFSAPLIFMKGKWTLLATPAYVIPQNLITMENRDDLSERGKKMFYVTVGGKISL
jgi:hypothetical protein